MSKSELPGNLKKSLQSIDSRLENIENFLKDNPNIQEEMITDTPLNNFDKKKIGNVK
jgi:hypothetical protein